MMSREEVSAIVKDYVIQNFLEGEDPSLLTEGTELMTTGILDSIGVLKLVGFIEDRFDIMLKPHEADAEHLNTLGSITNLVVGKFA